MKVSAGRMGGAMQMRARVVICAVVGFGCSDEPPVDPGSDLTTAEAEAETETETESTPPATDSGTPGPTGSAECPLTPLGREMLADVMRTHLYDARSMSSNFPEELVAAVRMVGCAYLVDVQASLSHDCRQPTDGVPWCTMANTPRDTPVGSFYDLHDTCHQFTCEGEQISVSDAWITMLPHSEPTDRHELTYDLDFHPGLTGRYTQNPLRSWRTDATDRADTRISAVLDDQLEVTDTTTGEVVDLRQDGTVAIRMNGQSVVSLDLAVAFPVLGPGDAATSGMVVNVDDQGIITGQVTADGVPLATVSGNSANPDYDAIRFEWLDGCAEE